jgi:hypothetical protein
MQPESTDLRRRRRIRRYVPFLVVAALFAVVIALRPSQAPDRRAAVPSPTSTGTAARGTTGGDTRHCTKEGTQYPLDLVRWSPPCAPRFTGDNGGATAPGVTKDSVKVIVFESIPNEQIEAILASQGLGSTGPQRDRADAAFSRFVNEHFELYGRHLDVQRVEGDCPTTPPDFDRCIAAAQKIVEMHPFAVIWSTTLYADVFDVFANAGILTFGGRWFDRAYYEDRAPYRWDMFLDGTQTADLIAELYCKNLAGKPADHAGKVIHPTIGGRDTIRHLGITSDEQPASVANAKRVQKKVKACTHGRDNPVIYTGSPDIETSAAQFQAGVARFISEGVTTSLCLCESVALIGTSAFTTAGYFPEHLVSGMGFTDDDTVGRLADPKQWAHAFGLSQIGDAGPADDSDASRVWRSQGHTGRPCGAVDCGLDKWYIDIVGLAVQLAGPHLDPESVRAGLMSYRLDAADPTQLSAGFGPHDYGLLDDVRVVYWDPNAKSAADGKPGAYIKVAAGRRYRAGQLPSDVLDDIPVQ